MLRLSRVWGKVSPVAIRGQLSQADLAFTPGHRPPLKLQLAMKYNYVNDKTRFASLEIIFDRLSGYAGRRQYKMQNDLRPLYEKIKAEGVDWHDLKHLSHPSLVALCRRVGMTPAEKAVLMPLLDARICGVLTRGSSGRDPQTVCYRPGLAEHGWRCGKGDHVKDVYFEKKKPAAGGLVELRRAEIEKRLENGVSVELREEPDFSVVGRLSHEAHPRVWSKPTDPVFNITTIGFEFKVHPRDPRAGPQIVAAAKEWQLHAEVIRSVLWEMLELYGVPRAAQPLSFAPGEFVPDDAGAGSVPGSFNSRDVSGRLVERRLLTKDGADQPWVRQPPPQAIGDDGTPQFLPFPPSVVIRAVYKPIVAPGEEATITPDEIESRLQSPMLDISMLVHPSTCFWFSPEDEAKCLGHVLSYAKRVPFALPFNLYMRVDPAHVQQQPEFVEKQRELLEQSRSYFDLAKFTEPHPLRRSDDDGDDEGVQDGLGGRGTAAETEVHFEEPSVNPPDWS